MTDLLTQKYLRQAFSNEITLCCVVSAVNKTLLHAMPSKQGPRVWARITNLQHPRFSLHDLIASHPVNHSAQLLLPGELPDIEKLGSAAPDLNLHNSSCMVFGPLGDIIHDLIAQQAWQHDDSNGSSAPRPVGVAIGPCMATSGGIAVTGDGVLHLSIKQSTYQQLGLNGRRSPIQKEGHYQITVQLSSNGCQPGQPYHERVVSRLNQVIGHSCLALAVPSTQHTTESQQSAASNTAAITSMSALLPSIPVSNIHELKTQADSWTIPNVSLPSLTRAALLSINTVHHAGQQHSLNSADSCTEQGVLTHSHDDMQVDAPEQRQEAVSMEGCQRRAEGSGFDGYVLEQILQWFGAISCKFPGTAVDAMFPVKAIGHGKGCVHVRQWSGLIHCDTVFDTADYAHQLVQSGDVPWAAVCMWGWEDSPVGWQGMEHSTGHTLGLAGEGTSHAVVVFMPNDDVLILKALTTADVTLPTSR